MAVAASAGVVSGAEDDAREPHRREPRAGVEPAFWSGRRVLVTGHTGFKGAWLTLWLQALGATVTGLSRGTPTEPSLWRLAAVGEGMEEVAGDVRDRRAVADAIDRAAPEVVFHLAAQPLVRLSYAEPRETFETNVLGTVNVLEGVRRCPAVRVLVNVTSDKCYAQPPEPPQARWPPGAAADDAGWPGHAEEARLGGDDPYSASKAAAEIAIAAYRSSFFADARAPRVASARAGNVIGGGDWATDRLLPDVMRAALEGRTVRIRNPEAVRPWQHVLNPLSGYLMLAQALWASAEHVGGWNFGPAPADMVAVRAIVSRVDELWPEGLRWCEGDEPDGASEVGQLRIDSAKARRRLGWEPLLDLDAGLRATVEWWRELRAGADMRAVTIRQIEASQKAGGRAV